ncbi:putative GPI-anchored cupredoxin [Colletotrichum spaethianum]|uniref:GPI-anchored cupredoxin n=1 Tax=Colletotrichum spaethianum TaxID=700344 RepID=A0AA37L573_9PEZI|nr:putative GPI-anchored cupredoxin [Colletotrichum spaethianum]GKT41941.1 putative GPI-anchored cupredoxin [Colletotrichum spaethianum]
MVWSSVLGAATLAILVKAQTPISPTPFLTTTAASAPSPTKTLDVKAEASSTESSSASIAAAETHTIAVGVSGWSFTPSKTEANVGDTIEWIFYPDAHSVIRAEFGFPCTPYEYVDIGRQGFYSGPQSVKAITNNMPRYRVLVNDTDPIFFYCGAPGSCYKEKMIGVINESQNSTKTLDKQLEAALPLTTQILPGESFPVESDAPKPTSGSGSSASSDGNGAVINNYHHSLSGGQIAGIVVGSLAFLLLGGGLIYLCGRRGGLDRAYRRASNVYQAQPPQPSQPAVTEVNYVTRPKTPTVQEWRSSHYSAFSGGPYHDSTPTGQFSPPRSPQPNGFFHPINGIQTYL